MDFRSLKSNGMEWWGNSLTPQSQSEDWGRCRKNKSGLAYITWGQLAPRYVPKSHAITMKIHDCSKSEITVPARVLSWLPTMDLTQMNHPVFFDNVTTYQEILDLLILDLLFHRSESQIFSK